MEVIAVCSGVHRHVIGCSAAQRGWNTMVEVARDKGSGRGDGIVGALDGDLHSGGDRGWSRIRRSRKWRWRKKHEAAPTSHSRVSCQLR